MPRSLIDALLSDADHGFACYDVRPLKVETRTPRACTAFFFGDSGTGNSNKNDAQDQASKGAVDAPPEQQIWPWPVPNFRRTEKMDLISRFLTGESPEDKPKPSFGLSGDKLDAMVKATHGRSQSAAEYATQAQEAAQEAISYDRGVVQAVDVADEAWDGAVYAKRANEELLKASGEIDKLGPPRKKLSNFVKRVAKQIELATLNPKDPLMKRDVGNDFYLFKTILREQGKDIEPVQNEGTEPLLKFLDLKDHPNLYPPADGPGMKDGAIDVPLHFPDYPDPMVMEDYTTPDMQKRMPAGSSPLDMSTLKGLY